ncbi:MAG: carboxymuconolactone decarboxylase family protein [Pseudomonadota bacterium]
MSGLEAAFKRAREYGIGEYLELLGELSQESTKKGLLERKTKELITLGIALGKGCERCIDIHTRAARQLGAGADELREVSKILLFMNASPDATRIDLWGEWKDSWIAFASATGPMQRRHRELVALGIGIVRQQPHHIELHTLESNRLGASQREIFEVVPIALLMDGAPVLSQIPHVLEHLPEIG